MLPEAITQLAEEERGIILVTGTTGSGKSTTLAAMIDQMNRNHSKHIVTIEDPIEFLHRDKRSIINQREVGMDTAGFKQALRRVLRQDPDVILVGEMRDEETVQTALSAAETGHLVLSTLHTVDAPETINRIIDFFPPHHQQQARAMIAGTLKGVISQRLVRTVDGHGRVACCEILRSTGRVKDMIMNPEETGRLQEVIAEGGFYGMQTFDQALMHHVRGRAGHDGGGHQGRHRAARLQAARRRRRPALDLGRAGHARRVARNAERREAGASPSRRSAARRGGTSAGRRTRRRPRPNGSVNSSNSSSLPAPLAERAADPVVAVDARDRGGEARRRSAATASRPPRRTARPG